MIELIKKEDDEVLFAIAEEIGNLRFTNSLITFFIVIFCLAQLQSFCPIWSNSVEMKKQL